MTIRYLVGDVFDRMSELADDSVDLILTSPPFLALRSYLPADHPDKSKEIGSEATPAEYIDVLLRLTAEWRRLLAPHGSLVVELGDTYSGSGGAGGDYAEDGLREGQPKFGQNFVGDKQRPMDDRKRTFRSQPRDGYSGGGPGWPLAKSLTLIPETYRFALAYGVNPHTGTLSPAGQWRVRNVVRWVRPNPPVGALGDKFRPATSELVVACISKTRWFDLDAVREPASSNTHARVAAGVDGRHDLPSQQRDGNWNTLEANNDSNPAGAPPLDWWDVLVDRINQEVRDSYDRGLHQQDSLLNPTSEQVETPGQHLVRDLVEVGVLDDGDTLRLSPKGTKAAHYAVFPSELCVKPIKTMCPRQVCRTCGQPRRRITGDVEYVPSATYRGGIHETASGVTRLQDRRQEASLVKTASTLGWSDCGHDNFRPGLVLDPFAGTGTTLAVAHGHGRDAIGIDIDTRSAELARDRVGPLFLEIQYA